MAETEFHVLGPFAIQTSKPERGGRRIDAAEIDKFWENQAKDHPKLWKSRGCYIFAIKNGRSIVPAYVGKTTNQNFKQEAFNRGNRDTDNAIISKHKGIPVFYFLLAETGQGRAHHIDYLETFLIQNAVMANPELKNVQRGGLGWKIAGVLRSDGGQPSKAAQSFRQMMHMGNLKKTRHEDQQNMEGLARLSESAPMNENETAQPKPKAKAARKPTSASTKEAVSKKKV